MISNNVENSCAASYFCENHVVVFFQNPLMVRQFKVQHLFLIYIFCNIIHFFTVNFYQFNA